MSAESRAPRQGDEGAVTDVAALYAAHARDLYRFALFLSGDPPLAEDIVSETFVRLWGARERVDFTTVKAYLFTIARNLFLQERRRARPTTLADDRLEDARPDPEAEALSRADLRATLAALQELPEIDRTALLMRVDSGLPFEDVAAALGISPGTARVKVHRARLRLAALRAARSAPDDSQENRP